MTDEEMAQKYTIANVCDNCNKCQSKGYINCDTFRFAKKAYLDRAKEEMLNPFGNTYINDLKIENKELQEENAKLKKEAYSHKNNVFAELNDETAHSNEELMLELAELEETIIAQKTALYNAIEIIRKLVQLL